jgi:Uma2 family endonuclease
MATGTGTLISEEEYLHTSYEPDCEFEDGVVIERNVGTVKHSELQALLSAYIARRRKSWGIRVLTELRFKIRAGKYLIPDVCVFREPCPPGPFPATPPLLWIEILSPEDRPVRVSRKVKELLAFGTPYVWVIDPETLESELHTREGSVELTDGVLRLPGTKILVPLKKVLED